MGIRNAMAKKYFSSDPHRESDQSMIPNTVNDFAEVPQEVIIKKWPEDVYFVDSPIDDTLGYIDGRKRETQSKIRAHMKPGK
jgi:hypothetical protein